MTVGFRVNRPKPTRVPWVGKLNRRSFDAAVARDVRPTDPILYAFEEEIVDGCLNTVISLIRRFSPYERVLLKKLINVREQDVRSSRRFLKKNDAEARTKWDVRNAAAAKGVK